MDTWAQRYGERPHRFFEDPFAAMVDATVMFGAEDYYESTRPKDPNAPPAPLTAEQVRIRGLKQANAFEEMETKLRSVGAR